MKICSLRNENLQFAKWESVVCEMKICSLRNDNHVTICSLRNDNPPKKAVSPRKFRLRGMRDVFVATYKLRRFWATDSNRKQDLFPFYMPWRHHITLTETICLKICLRTTAQECKKSFSGGRWTPYLNQKRHAIFKRTDKIHHCGFVVYFRTWWF